MIAISGQGNGCSTRTVAQCNRDGGAPPVLSSRITDSPRGPVGWIDAERPLSALSPAGRLQTLATLAPTAAGLCCRTRRRRVPVAPAGSESECASLSCCCCHRELKRKFV